MHQELRLHDEASSTRREPFLCRDTRSLAHGAGTWYNDGQIQGGDVMTLAYVESENRMVDVEAMIAAAEKMPPISLEEGRRAAEAIRQAVAARGEPEMTMEEIDAEIAQSRRERRAREAAGLMVQNEPLCANRLQLDLDVAMNT